MASWYSGGQADNRLHMITAAVGSAVPYSTFTPARSPIIPVRHAGIDQISYESSAPVGASARVGYCLSIGSCSASTSRQRRERMSSSFSTDAASYAIAYVDYSGTEPARLEEFEIPS